MDKETDPLWLHAYAGKEHGLMIIGTSEAIRNLAQRLLNAIDQPATSVSEGWPKEILTPKTIGPYKDVSDYTLSFHIKGATPLEEIVPLTRQGPHLVAWLVIAVCTVIGAVSIFKNVLDWVLPI